MISAAIGIFGGGSRVRISDSTTFDPAYNFYNITTDASDVDFTIDSADMAENKSYLIRKADDGIGHVVIKDGDGNELQTLYVEDNYCSVMYTEDDEYIIL
jgi:hypothetical protein